MSQIVNIHQIKKALKRRNELHAKLMSQCCRRALEHDKRCLRVLEAAAHSQRRYLFVLHPDAERELQRISHWLKIAIKRKEPWISQTDGAGRVLRLLPVRTLKQALELCREDEERRRRTRLAQDDLDLGNSPAHVRLLQTGGEGIVAVELMTEEALRWEGRRMRHCLGRSLYAERLTCLGFQYFSLRDRGGRPHVTLEVVDGRVTQCKGQANSDPYSRYGKAIENLADAHNWECPDVSAPAGPALMEELELDRMIVDHDLRLSPGLLPLPRTLYVDGALEAINLQSLTALPVVMSVRGDLTIRNCHGLRFMPQWLRVNGNAVIEDCSSIRRLASNFQVRGSLMLRNCPNIRVDPATTIVEGGLEVQRGLNAGVPPRRRASDLHAHPTRRLPIAT